MPAPSHDSPARQIDPVGPEYLTPAEAGRFLSVSAKQLEHWRRQGFGPPFRKWGRRLVRYHIAELREWASRSPLNNTAQGHAQAEGGAL